MVEVCDICGKEIQNKQALRIHRLSCAKAKEDSLGEKANELPQDNIHQQGGSVAPVSEPSDDLEIEEAEHNNPFEASQEKEGSNYCPLCNFQLKDYENPCSNCGAEVEWGN